VAEVFDLLDVVVGEVEHLQLRERLQTADLHDFVVVEFEFDQAGQLAESCLRRALPTMAGIRLFLSSSTRSCCDLRASSAMEPMRQLMKLASCG
jgi:hypothetical protein